MMVKNRNQKGIKMKKIKTILSVLMTLGLVSCSHQQPVFTFYLNEVQPDTKTSNTDNTDNTDNTGNTGNTGTENIDKQKKDGPYKLVRNPQSAISVAPTKILQLWMDNAYLAQLYDKKAIKEGYSGRREVLIYAIIYKDGVFQKFSKITDLANSMSSYQPVVVQKPNFFTETIDASYYQIIIKAFEVDTEGLVRILRRVDNTNVSKIANEASPYAPGATFVSGFQTVLHGFFDMILSVTGKSVDDWVEQIAADKIFEHSIYVVPASEDGSIKMLDGVKETKQKLILIASGDDLVVSGDNKYIPNNYHYPIWSELKLAGLPEGCSSFLLGDVVTEWPSTFSKKDCLKSADFEIAKVTKKRMEIIETPGLTLSELYNGSLNKDNTVLNDVSHIAITAIVK